MSEIVLQVGKKEVVLPEKLTIKQYQTLKTTTDLNKSPVKFLSALTGLDEKDIRYSNKKDMDFIMNYLTKNYMDIQKRDIVPTFEFEGVLYGLHNDLKTINYGGWVDLEYLMTDGVEKNIHRIMSIFYRPIDGWNKKRTKYYLKEYDHDEMMEQAELFLELPVEYWWSCASFFLQVGQISTDNMKRSLEQQKTKMKAIRRLKKIFPKWTHSKLFPDSTGLA